MPKMTLAEYLEKNADFPIHEFTIAPFIVKHNKDVVSIDFGKKCVATMKDGTEVHCADVVLDIKPGRRR